MKNLKTVFKITIVLVLSYAVSYAINFLIFKDTEILTLPNVVAWLFIAALIVYLFYRGDSKSEDR